MPKTEESLRPCTEESRTSHKQRRKHVPEPRDVDPVLFLEVQTGALLSLALATGFVLVLSVYQRETEPECRTCHEAQLYLDSVADKDVSPCEEFYQHVCGRWNKPGGFPDDVRNSGWLKLKDALEAYPWKTRRSSWVFRMLSFLYKTCKKELVPPKNLTYMLNKVGEATGLSWSLLSIIREEPEWLDLIIRMNVELNMQILFNIKYKKLGYSFGIHPTFQSTLLSNERFARLMTVARNVLQSSPFTFSQVDLSNTRKLHEKILRLSEPSKDDNIFGLVATKAIEKLGVGNPETWVTAVDDYTPRTLNITLMSTIDLYSLKKLQSILRLLFGARVNIKILYVFVHVVHESSVLAPKSGTPNVPELCMNEVERKELAAVKYVFSLYSLATKQTMSAARTIMTHAFLEIMTRLNANCRPKARARNTLGCSMRVYSFSTLLADDARELEELNRTYKAFPEDFTLYDTTFIGSLLIRSDFRLERQSHCLALGSVFAQQPLIVFAGEFCVSPAVLVAPMYYPGTDLGFKYGSLGTFFASSIVEVLLRSTRDGTPEQRVAYRELQTGLRTCYNDTKGLSHASNGTDLLTAYAMGMRAALGAFLAAAAHAGLGSKDVLSQRISFFRGSCLVLCS